MATLGPVARCYIAAVVVSAVALTVAAAMNYDFRGRWTAVAALALLNIFSESIAVRGQGTTASLNFGWIVGLASIPILGPWGAVLVAACGIAGWHSAPMVKRLFNTAQLSVSAAVAGWCYIALHGAVGTEALSATGWGLLNRVILPALAVDVVHCVVNGTLVAVILTLTSEHEFKTVVQGALLGSAVQYLGYGLFGLLLAVLWVGAGIGPFAAVLVLMPLYVARWAYAQYAEQQLAYDRTIRTLVQAVETKDLYTRGHSERVSKASVMIARRLGMREDRVNSLRYAGILHDVGKLGVPTRLLQKTGRLTEEEFSAIKMHPVRGLEMVREISFLDEAYAGIMHHHERLDGRGYPSGLAGGQIPEFARVIAVADAFDSMTTTRSYRGARSVDEAVEELQRCAGTQFDPTMVDALVTAIGDQGWQAETEPLFEPPAEPAAYRGYDHDDPTVEIAPAETDRA